MSARFIIAEHDDEDQQQVDTSIIPDDVLNLFWYHFGYNKNNISWIKLKRFIQEYNLDLTESQRLFLHNLQFK